MPDNDGENESLTSNHNANYEPPNSPDAEQDTRPHSIATDNVSMEFQQDGYVSPPPPPCCACYNECGVAVSTSMPSRLGNIK